MRDADVDEVARLLARMCEQHDFVGARAAHPNGRLVLARALHHDFQRLAEELLVDGEADLVLHGHERIQALLLDGLLDLVLHRRRRCARPLRVDEGVGRVVADFAQEGEHLLEVLIRLAGEADDEIRRQAHVGDSRADAAHEVAVRLHRVDTVHRLEDAVAAVLDRQVDVLTEVLAVADGRDDLVREVLWVRGHEAHAADARHLVDHLEEICKVCELVVLAVGVDILAEQRDFLIAVLHGLLNLMHDVLRQAAALAAAHIRHDAISAEIVAAVHDWHPSREAARACDGYVVRQLRLAELHVDDVTVLRLDLLHDVRELVDLVGAEHEVDVRRALDERIALFLRHAARDAEDQLWVLALEALDLADLAVDAVLRRLAHAAGVDEDEVCLLHQLRPLIADRAELPHHALRIALVHLASVYYHFNETVNFSIDNLHI